MHMFIDKQNFEQKIVYIFVCLVWFFTSQSKAMVMSGQSPNRTFFLGKLD